MNICFITSQYPPVNSGLSTTVYRIARNLAIANHNVHVIAPGLNRLENVIAPSWEEGIKVHRTYPSLGDYSGNYIELNEISTYVSQLHQEVGFDLLHCSSILLEGLVGDIISKNLCCPLVTSFQNRDLLMMRYNPVLIRSVAKVIQQSSAVVVPISELLCDGISNLDINSNIFVAPNGFDPNIFDQRSLQELIKGQKWRNRLFGENILRLKSNGAVVIGTASIIRPEKGFPLCLSAFKELQNVCPNTYLLHIGDFANPEEKEMSKKLIGKLGLKRRVFFTGFVPHNEVLCWMKEMDIFIFPALYCGTSNTLLEAMGIGLPVIASDIEGINRFIIDGEDGLLTQPRATELLGHMMKLLVENTDLRERLGRVAKLKVKKQFSANKELEFYQDVYHGVIGSFRAQKGEQTDSRKE